MSQPAIHHAKTNQHLPPIDIDPEPTAAERSAAEALIAAELSSDTSPNNSSPLPPLREPSFSALITAELSRVAAKQPLTAIDTSRYEQDPDAPLPTDAAELQARLARAQTAATYLSQRRAHLSLLDEHGRNAWLVGNWRGAEAEAAALERELAAVRRALDRVNLRRRAAQVGDLGAGGDLGTGGGLDGAGGVAAELKGLADAWRRGVGRVLETEAAAEELRRQVLEERRKLAAGGGGDMAVEGS